MTSVEYAGPNMEFAIQDKRLLVLMHAQFEDRGWHVLYLMLQALLSTNGSVPDLYASFVTLQGDHLPEDAGQFLDPSTIFAFWRPPGAVGSQSSGVGGVSHGVDNQWSAEAIRLLPDWDFSGWGKTWIAPMSLVTERFTEEMPPWHKRLDIVFWSGAVKMSKERREFRNCANQEPRFHIEPVRWPQLRMGEDEPQVKPASADLRKMLRYKFLIYLPGATWSTSIKRMLVAGAAVLLPNIILHETMVSEVLRECSGCVFYYDNDDLCNSVKKIVKEVPDDAARRSAEKLNAFARERFSDASVSAYVLEALRKAAKAQTMSEEMKDRVRSMTAVNCTWLKDQHKQMLGPKLSWQVDEWFEDSCLVRNSTYLRNSPI